MSNIKRETIHCGTQELTVTSGAELDDGLVRVHQYCSDSGTDTEALRDAQAGESMLAARRAQGWSEGPLPGREGEGFRRVIPS